MTLHEMCYTNILQILTSHRYRFVQGIERKAALLRLGAGGPCTYNPEPIADFDIFYRRGRDTVRHPLSFYKKAKADGLSREEFLHEAAKIEGLYVLGLYEVEYNEDGTICCMKPKYDDIPVKIKKQVQVDLTN